MEPINSLSNSKSINYYEKPEDCPDRVLGPIEVRTQSQGIIPSRVKIKEFNIPMSLKGVIKE
jgi:hypothetical protein